MGISDNIIGNILGKPKSRGGKKDWDGDGVPNKKDCQPRNTMRQDSLQNLKNKFKRQYSGDYALFLVKLGGDAQGWVYRDRIGAINHYKRMSKSMIGDDRNNKFWVEQL